jgi:IS5 family transposase
LEQIVPLVKQVAGQAARRVFEGEAVPAGEELVSLFEPHTAIIVRGKLSRAGEFGRKVWLDDVNGGVSRRFQVLVGNPSDDGHLALTLAHHQRLFAHPPDLFARDRGVHPTEHEVTASLLGVKQVHLPRPRARSSDREAYERQAWFRAGACFRAGIEGRISFMRRRGYRARCRDKGDDGFERWVSWG